MSFFSKILDKLGLHKEKEEQQPAAIPAPVKPAVPAHKPVATPVATAAAARPTAPAPKPVAPVATATPAKPHDFTKDVEYAPKREAPVAAPKPISEVDVVRHLEQLSTGKNLNWKVSIVDLLKLLDLDSSYEARVELAKELNCPPELMSDSARMNTWLHKTVLKKIAENGGNIPQDLLD